MSTCPNCNYKLVLLPKQRYKCALCNKSYPKKYIENKEFRDWNKRQRKLDLEDFKTSFKPKPRFRLSEAERKLRAKKYAEKWRNNNREVYNNQKRDYYNRNLDQINSKQRGNYDKNRQKIVKRKELWAKNNPHKYKIKKKLADLRYQQKLLALKILEKNDTPRPKGRGIRLVKTKL